MRPPTCLQPGTVVVWWARAATASWSLISFLDEAEEWRLARYTQRARRESFVAGVVLAKLLVADYTGSDAVAIRFDRTCPHCQKPHWKPRLSPPLFEISISHSADLVAVALAMAPVGLDVESVSRPFSMEHAAAILSDEELNSFRRLPTSQRRDALATSWTRKEAALKAIGIGLELDPRQVVVSSVGAPARLLSLPEEMRPAEFSLLDVEVPRGYVGALASLRSVRRVENHNRTHFVGELAERARGRRDL